MVKRIDRSSFAESADGCAWVADLSDEEWHKASELHYLIISSQEVPRVHLLSDKEQPALWRYAEQMAAEALNKSHINSVAVLLNDGIAAGQTVGHIHIHIVGFCTADIIDLSAEFDCLTNKYCEKSNQPVKKAELKTSFSQLASCINNNFEEFLNDQYGFSVFSSKTITDMNENEYNFSIEAWDINRHRNYGLTNLIRVMNGYKEKPYDWPAENKEAVFNKVIL